MSRPSSLPLPRSVAELLPPPCVPKELNSPSKPSTMRSNPKTSLKKPGSVLPSGIPSPVDIRAGSLSPAVPARRGILRSNANNRITPTEKSRLVKSVAVNKNKIKGEVKMCPPPPGRSISLTTRNKSGTPTIKQQQDRTIPLYKKPLRDQNRALGNTSDRVQGRGVSRHTLGPNQPDLVKVSRPNHHNNSIAKLESANDRLSRQLENSRLVSQENAKGFCVMAVVVGYLAPDALSVPQLNATIALLQREIKEEKTGTGDLRVMLEKQIVLMKKRDDQWKEEKHHMEQNLNILLKKHEEELKECHSKEEHIKEKHMEQIYELEGRHEEELNGWKSQHDQIVSDFESKHVVQEKELSDAWVEEKTKLEEDILELEAEIKVLQNNFLKDSDSRVQVIHTKNINLLQEIDSLKTVVDMRTAEIHGLRAERSRLEEKLELFDTNQENLKKLIAQVEDLKEQISTKLDVERKLSVENEVLNESLEKESSEKKRLSMENEQLFYKIWQASEPSEKFPEEDNDQTSDF